MEERLLDAGGLEISASEVARLAHCGASARFEADVRVAIEDARSLVAPRARWMPLPEDATTRLFSGGTPVAPIAALGTCWLFAATIAEALEQRVRECFAAGEYLRGVLLDAAGSVAADAVCDAVERACAGAGPSARYSPGYCMWRLDSQTEIFSLLRPEEIGIRLTPSMLMIPLKSVTGIVVKAASEEDLRVPPEACDQCDAVGCTRRGLAA